MIAVNIPARSPVQVSNPQHPRYGHAGVTINTPEGEDGQPVESAVVVLFDLGNELVTVSRADLRQL